MNRLKQVFNHKQTLTIYGEVGLEMLSGFITLTNQCMREKDDDKPKTLVLFIDSDGGDIDYAYRICKFLDVIKTRYHLITVGLGYVSSAAVTIFLKGDERYALQDTEFLIHQVRHYTNSPGVLESKMKKYTKSLAASNKKLARDLFRDIKLTAAERARFNKGADLTFKTPTAIKKGIIDGVLK